jgi:hypothetical protein
VRSAGRDNALQGAILPALPTDAEWSVLEAGRPFPAPWRRLPLASVLSVRDGDLVIASARIDWYSMGFLRKLKVYGASVGPAGRARSAPGVDQVHGIYKAALDALLRHHPRPLVLRFAIGDDADADIDALWRLAVSLDASCLIGDEDAKSVVQLQFPGAKAALATFFGAFPGKAIAGSAGSVMQMIRGRRKSPREDHARRFTVLGFDTSKPSPPVSAPATLRFAEVSREEVERRPARYGVTPHGGVAPKGGQCFAGYLDLELVYRMWLRFDDETVHSALPAAVRNAVQRPAVLISGCHTAVAHRGKNIYPAALNWVADRAREKGARQLLLFVNVENTPSLRAASKAGFTKVMDIVLGGIDVKRVHE